MIICCSQSPTDAAHPHWQEPDDNLSNGLELEICASLWMTARVCVKSLVTDDVWSLLHPAYPRLRPHWAMQFSCACWPPRRHSFFAMIRLISRFHDVVGCTVLIRLDRALLRWQGFRDLSLSSSFLISSKQLPNFLLTTLSRADSMHSFTCALNWVGLE